MTRHPLKLFYAVSFFLTLQVALVAYFSSSYLSAFVDQNSVGLIFALSSLVAIVALVKIPKIIETFGNYGTFAALIGLIVISLIGLFKSSSALAAIFFFTVYTAANYLSFFAKDIFIETYSKDVSTGRTRGIFLTVLNLAWLCAPLFSGYVADNFGYGGLFAAGLIAIIPAIPLFILGFKGFKDPPYKKMAVIEAVGDVIKNKNISGIYMVNFLLQFFYAWMVIYAPLYLHQVIGLSWEKIGVIFSVTLLPFILFQYPVGKLSDRIGEKEMLAIGFVIISLSTGLMFFIDGSSILLWSIILFMTRVGAAMIEVLSESYFFKQVSAVNDDAISFYRNALPLSYVIAPIIATVLLYFMPIKSLYLILALIMLLGLKFVRQLKDTA